MVINITITTAEVVELVKALRRNETDGKNRILR